MQQEQIFEGTTDEIDLETGDDYDEEGNPVEDSDKYQRE